MRSSTDRPSLDQRAAALAAALFLAAAAPAAEAPGGGDPPRPEDRIRELVRSAIDRGAASLLGVLPRLVTSPPPDYTMGRLALPTAALLRSGVPSTDPTVTAALRFLERMPPEEVYSVACYLMALDALAGARSREARQRILEGTSTTAVRPIAEGGLKIRMEELVRWLVKIRNRNEGTWHYRAPGNHDYSNTQFAVLGLGIGLEHGIAIPREVFAEIARQFGGSAIRETREFEFKVTLNPQSKAFSSGGGPTERTIRTAAAGWAYRRGDREPYASMTAAGASSILVARDGLGGVLPPAAAAALDSSLAWIVAHFDRFMESPNHPYYTLYSLEKVGDIGDIVTLDRRDWYHEGSLVLLRDQSPDGSWGDYVNTSFALLFLTRATRPALRALPPPRVTTLAGGGDGGATDLVHVSAVGGYISARDFFEYLQLTGDRSLLKVAAEVVRNYPLHRQGELIPWILPLWADRTEGMASFARKALAEATGESYKTAEEYRRWHETYALVRAAETVRDRDEARIGGLLAAAPGEKLRARVLELIGRERLAACAPAVIEVIPGGSGDFARRAAEILERITGIEAVDLDGLETREGRESAAAAWRAIWGAKGAGVLAAGRIRKLIADLDGAAGSRAAGGAADPLGGLAAEGRQAVPVILEAMEGDEYPAALVIALERISGKRLGLRRGPWKAWWEAGGR